MSATPKCPKWACRIDVAEGCATSVAVGVPEQMPAAVIAFGTPAPSVAHPKAAIDKAKEDKR